MRLGPGRVLGTDFELTSSCGCLNSLCSDAHSKRFALIQIIQIVLLPSSKARDIPAGRSAVDLRARSALDLSRRRARARAGGRSRRQSPRLPPSPHPLPSSPSSSPLHPSSSYVPTWIALRLRGLLCAFPAVADGPPADGVHRIQLTSGHYEFHCFSDLLFNYGLLLPLLALSCY